MVKLFAKTYFAGLVVASLFLTGCVTVNKPTQYVDDMPRLVGMCEVVDSKFHVKWVFLVKEEEDEFPASGCAFIEPIVYKIP